MLKDMTGRSVILVGQQQSSNADGSYTVVASDGNAVQVFLPPNETIDAS
jgi:hypothetical protein